MHPRPPEPRARGRPTHALRPAVPALLRWSSSKLGHLARHRLNLNHLPPFRQSVLDNICSATQPFSGLTIPDGDDGLRHVDDTLAALVERELAGLLKRQHDCARC